AAGWAGGRAGRPPGGGGRPPRARQIASQSLGCFFPPPWPVRPGRLARRAARVELPFALVMARRLLLKTTSSRSIATLRKNLIHGETTEVILTAARKVHSRLGPGLLEHPYKVCLAIEMRRAGIKFESEKLFPVVYDGITTSLGYRVDFIVDDKVIVEVKAVEHVLPIHVAQLISYLNLSHLRVGLLLNFNVERFADGIHRKVWGYN